MRSLTDAEKEIIAKHALWLRDEVGGARASLNGANLQGADLHGADLQGAYLHGADLHLAYLHGANLHGANLHGADLQGADLHLAYLQGANLHGADLQGADLQGADLHGANLHGADLQGAYLHGANLHGANLTDAKNADLAIAMTRILTAGTLIGWKKCQGNVIVKLEIPANAKRSSAFGRKCRAEFAKVLEVIGAEEGVSEYHDNKSPVIHYRIGEVVRPATPFCEDFTQECAPGVHFWITELEARNQ
jgi:hypothetical protein